MNAVDTIDLPKVALNREAETNWKNKEKELNDNQVGWIELRSGEGGKFGLINVRDRFGERLWLPCEVAENKQPDLEDKLKKLGYEASNEAWVKMDIDERTREQLYRAEAFLPPLLAVHAVMNHPQGDFFFPPVGNVDRLPPPLIGLEAKPHSGKTLGMLMTVITNQGLVNGFDFDPFSGQSFNHCTESVLKIMEERGLDPKTSTARDMMRIIGDVYEQEKSEAVLKAKSNVNLRWLLDNAIEIQLNEANPKNMQASLVDLPGEDERTKKWDVMHLIRHIIPTVDMTRKRYVTQNIREEYADPTSVPILDKNGQNYHEIFVIFDMIRSELGGWAHYHTIPEEKKAINRALKHQIDFIEALETAR